MAYILKNTPSMVETPNNRFVVGGSSNPTYVPTNLDPTNLHPNITTQQGGIVDAIRDKADQVAQEVRDKIDEFERADTNNPYTDQNGTQTDSSSLTDTSQTIDSLNNYIDNLGGQLSNWKQFYDLMNRIYYQTGTEDFVSGDSARLAITEKIADMVYNFTSTLYSNAFQSQMWYEQQEYNSPIQQLHRLADAGLLGMSSQISTGNAQSAANSSALSPAESSDAAAIQQQAKQARMDRIMQGIGLSLQFASLGMQGFQAATDFGVKAAQKELISTQSANLKAMQIPQILNLLASAHKTESEVGVAAQMAQFKGQEVANAVKNTENTLYMWQQDYNQRQSQFQSTLQQEKDIAFNQLATQERMNSANNATSVKIAQMNNDKAEELANNFEWVEDGYFMYTGENQTDGRWVSSEEVTDMMEKTANGDFSVGSKTLGMDLGLSGSLKGTDVLKQLRSTDFGQSIKVGNTTFRRQSRTVRMTLNEALKRQKAAANADKHNLGDFPSLHTNTAANKVFLHNQSNLQNQSAKVAGYRATASVMSPPEGPR